MTNQQFSPSGQPIYHHSERTKEFQLSFGDEKSIEQIGKHIEKHLGTIAGVYHEIVSDLVHIDIYMIAPTAERNFYTLVTCGMSHLPMTVPPGAEPYRFAELMIALPPDWKLSDEAFKDENNYWPIRLLKTLARFPHTYDTWLYIGHTIPNGNPVEAFAKNTKMNGTLLSIPTLAEDIKSFFTLQLNEDKSVHFYSLIPLFENEMKEKLKHGADYLFDKFDQAGVNEILQLGRKNVSKKFFGLF